MMNQEILSRKKIVKDMGYGRVIISSGFFFLVGLAVELSPFIYWEGDLKKLLINMLAMSVLSIPFCYIIGIRNIVNAIRDILVIKKGSFVIEEDIVTDKRRVNRENDNYRDCQVDLKKYSKRSGKAIWFNRREEKQINIGDKYYVFYLYHKNKYTFYSLYEIEKYKLDDDLKKFLKDID